MTRLIRAEVVKLRSIRTYRLLALGALALIAAGVTATSLTASHTSGANPARATLALAGLAQTFALIAGALAVTTEFRIALPVLASRHIASHVDAAQLAAIVAGGAVATALATALGVGAGAVIRNQVGAVVTVLGLLYVAEPLLGFIPHAGSAVQTYGLGGLASGATATTGFPAGAHLLGQVPAALVLAAYALAFLAVGAALLRRRDIAA
jgi:ABC-2 type transport system permease protein